MPQELRGNTPFTSDMWTYVKMATLQYVLSADTFIHINIHERPKKHFLFCLS